MPLPVMHSFAGYAIYKAGQKKETPVNWLAAGLAMFLANLADFDFAAGILYGDTTKFHRGVSHTLGGALVCGLLVSAISWAVKKGRPYKVFAVSFAAYYSHVILDFLGGTSRPMQLFWPVIPAYYHSSLNLFLPLNISFPADAGFLGFAGGLFSVPCLARLVFESGLVYVMISGARAFKKIRESRLQHVPSLIGFSLILVFFLTFAGVHALMAG